MRTGSIKTMICLALIVPLVMLIITTRDVMINQLSTSCCMIVAAIVYRGLYKKKHDSI